jgi:thiamine-phosphate pyrophosphorylase
MKLLVISPEDERADEARLVPALFRLGLQKYHLRKPGWSAPRLERLIEAFPREYWCRLVLHSHHHLATTRRLGGIHYPDNNGSPSEPANDDAGPGYRSFSCHDLESLHRLDGCCDAVLLAPIFASLSKPGHGPSACFNRAQLVSALARRPTGSRTRTSLCALGGINAATTTEAAALGFDGVAALGAVWGAADPVRAFSGLQELCAVQAAGEGMVLGQRGVGPGRWS